MSNDIITQQILSGWKLTIYIESKFNLTDIADVYTEAAKQLEREAIKQRRKKNA